MCSTTTERRVAAIYARILELDRVDAEDDLHTLGGDSVQAVRIALEIESAFRIGLPLDIIERSSRVRDIAAWIDRKLSSPPMRPR